MKQKLSEALELIQHPYKQPPKLQDPNMNIVNGLQLPRRETTPLDLEGTLWDDLLNGRKGD